LDHLLASGRNVNILVLDTEVYSNTGGQMSKSTPRGAVAKFAAGGKQVQKKDLAQIAMPYGNGYVAQVAMGASDAQTVRAILEAEAYEGVSLIIAYSHCIAHGINMSAGMEQQKAAVDCGHWPLFRYHPGNEHPLSLDSKAPKLAFKDYAYQETRYNMLAKSQPQAAARLLEEAQADVTERWHFYEQLATIGHSAGAEPPTNGEEK
ncbi:MAG: pyruvate:ferredoxin (flavodoxin) oxidoreductase, partial [Candidatus Latescibacteria bacterium]|nr:pyruvate:ferredoxin (flavodoxin) oxidoreductase [Candidatus Latescibacterota bacterium]